MDRLFLNPAFRSVEKGKARPPKTVKVFGGALSFGMVDDV